MKARSQRVAAAAPPNGLGTRSGTALGVGHDTTIKPIYGHQEGATLGYNPHKPGRPSHAYHTYSIATLRLVLDVEVSPGDQHASAHGFEGLWRLWDRLTPAQRPESIRGDAPYGQELLMAECERCGQKYLFRQRRTKGIKNSHQSP